MTLVILAAGKAIRYGKLKQIEEVGPNHEFISDYNIKDAITAGFNKIILVIRHEIEPIIKKAIIEKYNNINIDLVYEENPLGTGYALLCAKNKIQEDFAVINSDDLYGKECFILLANFFKTNNRDLAIVGYRLINTLNGQDANRAIIKEENHNLISLEESIIKNGSNMDFNIYTSMNAMALRKSILPIMEIEYNKFKINNLKNKEFMLPSFINHCLKLNYQVKILPTDSKWYGLTYPNDKFEIINYLKERKN